MTEMTIRRLEMRDLYKITAIVDKETAELANIEWPFTRDVATAFITEFNTWGIFIGGSILVGAMEIKHDYETAYLVAKSWRNQGIATDALNKLKEVYHDKQLWCLIKPENKASLRVAQKSATRVKWYAPEQEGEEPWQEEKNSILRIYPRRQDQ